jgi:hypothetical protein
LPRRLRLNQSRTKLSVSGSVSPEAPTQFLPYFDCGRQARCPPALSGQADHASECPLSGAKSTSRLHREKSAYDPKRTFQANFLHLDFRPTQGHNRSLSQTEHLDNDFAVMTGTLSLGLIVAFGLATLDVAASENQRTPRLRWPRQAQGCRPVRICKASVSPSLTNVLFTTVSPANTGKPCRTIRSSLLGVPFLNRSFSTLCRAP